MTRRAWLLLLLLLLTWAWVFTRPGVPVARGAEHRIPPEQWERTA